MEFLTITKEDSKNPKDVRFRHTFFCVYEPEKDCYTCFGMRVMNDQGQRLTIPDVNIYAFRFSEQELQFGVYGKKGYTAFNFLPRESDDTQKIYVPQKQIEGLDEYWRVTLGTPLWFSNDRKRVVWYNTEYDLSLVFRRITQGASNQSSAIFDFERKDAGFSESGLVFVEDLQTVESIRSFLNVVH